MVLVTVVKNIKEQQTQIQESQTTQQNTSTQFNLK